MSTPSDEGLPLAPPRSSVESSRSPVLGAPRDRRRDSTPRQIFGFAALGAFSFTLTLVSSWTLHRVVGWSEGVAFAATQATVFVTNFVICRYLVFGRSEPGWGREMMRFGIASLLARGMELLLFLAIQASPWRLPMPLAVVVVLSLSFFAKFFLYRRFVWRADR